MSKDEKKASDLAAAAAEANEPEEVEPTTVEYAGKTYTIDPAASGDVELIEALAELDEGNHLVLPRVVRSLVGDAQYAAFKESVRDAETGRVPVTALREFFREIDAALGE
jgi:hypothetical protein